MAGKQLELPPGTMQQVREYAVRRQITMDQAAEELLNEGRRKSLWRRVMDVLREITR